MMRTKTSVHSQKTAQSERRHSQQAAWGALAAVQMGAQILLWITFLGYDRVGQAIWQAAILLIVPLTAVWMLWRAGAPAMASRSGRYIALALIPCLILDLTFSLFAFSGSIGQTIPQYPGWIGVAVPCAVALLASLSSRPRGVSYGAYLIRWALLTLFLVGTVFLRASTRSDRLWPLLGRGFSHTALTALLGAGSVWGTALTVLLPGETAPRGRTFLRSVVPWAMGCLWALWHGFLRPWAQGDVLAVGEKMMGLARHASSITLYEMAGLLWLVLLPLSIIGCMTSGEVILRAAFPRLPRAAALAGMLALPAMSLLFWPGHVLGVLEQALPWRIVLSLAAGAALAVIARKEARR